MVCCLSVFVFVSDIVCYCLCGGLWVCAFVRACGVGTCLCVCACACLFGS